MHIYMLYTHTLIIYSRICNCCRTPVLYFRELAYSISNLPVLHWKTLPYSVLLLHIENHNG